MMVPKTRLKRDMPIGSKNKNSWMRKWAKMQDDLIEKVEIPKDLFYIINDSILEEPQVPKIVEKNDISIIMLWIR